MTIPVEWVEHAKTWSAVTPPRRGDGVPYDDVRTWIHGGQIQWGYEVGCGAWVILHQEAAHRPELGEKLVAHAERQR